MQLSVHTFDRYRGPHEVGDYLPTCLSQSANTSSNLMIGSYSDEWEKMVKDLCYHHIFYSSPTVISIKQSAKLNKKTNTTHVLVGLSLGCPTHGRSFRIFKQLVKVMVALLSPRVHPWMRRLSLGRERRRYKAWNSSNLTNIFQMGWNHQLV